MTDENVTEDEGFDWAVREWLLDMPSFDPEWASRDTYDKARSFVDGLLAQSRIRNPGAAFALFHLYLRHSLCPLHHWDYAICFDDQLAECEDIRSAYPGHDT